MKRICAASSARQQEVFCLWERGRESPSNESLAANKMPWSIWVDPAHTYLQFLLISSRASAKKKQKNKQKKTQRVLELLGPAGS